MALAYHGWPEVSSLVANVYGSAIAEVGVDFLIVWVVYFDELLCYFFGDVHLFEGGRALR